MASLARIPFRPADEEVINTLNGWMFFMAIMHFVGGALFLTCGCFGAFAGAFTMTMSPAGGMLTIVQMLLLLVLGVVMTAEGVLLVQSRSALNQVVSSDVADQEKLSVAFQRLKFFFMLELGWFGINVLVAILGLIVALVAPEMADGGFDLGALGGDTGPGGNW